MKILFALIIVCAGYKAESSVLLRDIGVLGLASHDLFTWDKENEVNTENGRFDLSTIFDYKNGRRWKKGGNPKNSENAPVFTTTMTLVDFYKAKLQEGFSEFDARKQTVAHFHSMIKDSFERMTGLNFPQVAINADVTNVEQAAMRGIHDILPGRVKLFGRRKDELVLTNLFKVKTFLNEKEMNQTLKNFDGDYDEEYKNIKIPFSRKIINLKKIDGEFIEKFSPYRHDDMLLELAEVGKGNLKIEDVSFMSHLHELFSKGICSTNNEWMPKDTTCY